MSSLSDLAKKRNWSKYRLMGVTFANQGLTPEELNKLSHAKAILDSIISPENWNRNSKLIGLKPLKDKEK